MSTDQARALCAALDKNPDEAVGDKPRYVAIVACFDEEAAKAAMDDHHVLFEPVKPRIPRRGSVAETLAAKKGGAR